jgi:hypothetical protein
MRTPTLLVLAFGALFAAATPALADETADPAIAQCIRDNAPAVERAVSSLNDAVDFLTRKVCAVPVAALAERVQHDAMQKWSDQMKAYCLHTKAAGAKPDEDANTCDENFDYSGMTLFAARGGMPEPPAPPDATALAAKLLLDLRLAHLNKNL